MTDEPRARSQEPGAALPRPWLDVPLASLPLSNRVRKRLAAEGYQTLAEVARDLAPHGPLTRLPWFGDVCRSEVRRIIKERRNEHARNLRAAGLTHAQIGERMGVTGESARRWSLGRGELEENGRSTENLP